MKTLSVALAVSLVLALTSFAEAKPAKRLKHHAKPAPATSQRSARMIEVKPGYWISSFGCTLDAGYGRITPCDFTDGNR